ncbi:MAG: tetratricopeptide repeat protein [Planctomycetota bacterium]|jgi:tetratricopeptide (TPR) repeat protein
MKKTKDTCFAPFKPLLVLSLVCVGGPCCFQAFGAGEPITEGIDFSAFQEALDAADDQQATSVGNSIFERLEKRHRGDAGFGAFKSKLVAAEFLARKMGSQLNAATKRQTLSLVDELFDEAEANQRTFQSFVPAKNLHETSKRLFSKSLKIANLTDQEKTFLAKYYDLRLRMLTSAIARAGQALAIAEPSFKGTHDYVLVLPLLHASETRPISTDVLPRWMKQPEQMSIFSDSCLMHFGSALHAMQVARQSARIQNATFSEIESYKSAAQKCAKSHPHVSVDCLRRALEYVPDNDANTIVDLQFQILEIWLDSQNYALAAGRARTIFEDYPSHNRAAKAIWQYHYALSRDNNTDEILAHIDQALANSRCEQYRPKLMFVKWWALRRKRNETARAAALEYELLKQYGDDPMVAPILLSQATDLLTSQDYGPARESLAKLIAKFPTTKAAGQAEKMLARLESVNTIQ